MPQYDFSLSTPCLDNSLSATVSFAGQDLCVLVMGGHGPHVGSVSVGVPRKSLQGDGNNSATVSTLNMTGHKDDAVGNLFAHDLAARLGVTVSVTCGIHFDGATKEDLATIMDSARTLADTLLEQLLRKD